MSTTRRVVVVVLLGAVLATVGVLDRLPRRSDDRPAQLAARAGMPVAPPPSAVTSSWYCPLLPGPGGELGTGLLDITNAGDEPRVATVTLVPEAGGEPRSVPVTLAGGARVTLVTNELVEVPHVGVLVDIDGGDVVVEHGISGPKGDATAPCAASASDRWYFAHGTTVRDARMLLALFNPFPEDAIVDFTFATDEGPAVPGDLAGRVVPGRSLVLVDVGEHVRRREAIATTIVARSGRLVVDRLIAKSGAPGQGLSLELGAPTPGDAWYFPDALRRDGVRTRFHLYNPTDEEALVDVLVNADEGVVDPFEVTIGPQDRVTLDLGAPELGAADRVPVDVGLSVTVLAAVDVPIVAERTVDATAPAERSGTSAMHGARLTADRWVLSAGATTETLDEWVTILNPGAEPVTVSVVALASGQRLPIEGLQDVTVEAGRRAALRIGDHVRRADLPLLVAASGDVVVQRDIYRVGGLGLSSAMGVPLR